MKKSSRSGGFMEDFLEWTGSPEGVESMDALDCVFDALDGAKVDTMKKKILWPDGESLSIEQSVEKIRKDSALGGQAILRHLIGWLQMGYVPEGLDEEQMERFEDQVETWVQEYENDLPPEFNS